MSEKKNLTEFEKQLKEKYGANWMFVELTDEEYEQVEVDVEAIKQALKKGFEEVIKIWENRPTHKDLGKRFR